MLSTLAVGYLFLGGTGAGTCAVLSVVALLVPRQEIAIENPSSARLRLRATVRVPETYRRLLAPGFAAAFVALALGSAMLVADLGDPAMAVALFLHPTATFMSAGAFSLVVCLAVSAFLSVAWGLSGLSPHYLAVRAFEWVGVAFGLFTALYTGLLLSTMGTVPFWDSMWLPVLFVLSSLSCGFAVAMASAGAFGGLDAFGRLVVRMMRCDVAALACEAAAAALLVASAFAHPYAVAAQGAESLLAGTYAAAFVLGFGVCGLLAPAVLETYVLALKKRHSMVVFAIAALALTGAFLMRYCIVAVGMHPEVWTVL